MRNKYALYLASLAFLSAAGAQIPKEKMHEFIATGAVISFDEICLKVYTDHAKADQWMQDHASDENKTAASDPYREEKTDRVFLVGSSLATFVVTFGEVNRCTIYSMPAEKKAVEEVLGQLMAGYAKEWKTTFEKIEDDVSEKEHVMVFEADIPGTDKPILMIHVVFIKTQGSAHPLFKISGISLRRIQTSQPTEK